MIERIWLNVKAMKSSAVFIAVLALLAGCDSGETLSGGEPGELAIVDATAFVGVYSGSEAVTLTRQSDSEEIESQENEIQFTISADGNIVFRSDSGANGSASLQQNQRFTLRSEAALNFDGRCENGVVILEARVEGRSIEGTYRSDALVCGGEAFTVTGSVTAAR